jgi:tagaturonate reductase
MLDTSEFFHLWVIEGDKNLSKELPFAEIGLNVIWTDNLEMYRTRKVRILNGAHTALTPYALLKGFDTVKSCIDNPEMNKYLKKCIFDEIIPTLDLPKDELLEYANNVLERFTNPFIKHYLSSIALNSVSKFKVRVLPSILEYIKRYGKIPETLVFSLAMLIKFYKDEMTFATKVNDAEEIKNFMKNADISDILSNVVLWDTDLSFLLQEVEKYVD